MSLRIALLSPAVGSGNIGDRLIEMSICRLLRDDVEYRRFSIREPLAESDLEAINATRAALICGTNLYQHDWHCALTPQVLDRIAVPVIPVGLGSSAARIDETAVSEQTRQMIRAFHSRCVAGGVRDPHSAAVVARVGVANAVLTGCPVLFWHGGEGVPPVRAVTRRRVVITARNWLMHCWPDNVDHPVQVRLVQKLLESFPLDQLVFAIHEDYDARLVDLLNIPGRIVFSSDKAEEYVRLYSDEANVILAMRLHAGMLALGTGVPAVFVGHDSRTYSFCAMLGLPYVDLFREDCADVCIARLRQMLDGDVTSLAAAQASVLPLRQAMDEFLVANALPHRPRAAAPPGPMPQRAPKRRLRLVVLGMMGRCPFAGQTWLYVNWLRGLVRLGHEVWYVEDDTVWPYDPERDTVTEDCSYAVRHVARCMERIGLPHRWAFRLATRAGACWGLSPAAVNDLYRSCDALLNIVGATDLREEHLAAPCRIYVETDPVTAELRLENGDEHTRIAFGNHQIIATYGENYGAPDCPVPLAGRSFVRTRQPVDLDLWSMTYMPDAHDFTTVGNYRQDGHDVPFNGDVYRWSKHHEWEKFMDLPERCGRQFELAVMLTEAADRSRLESHGWRVRSPFRMSLDVFGGYSAYIRSSRAEFTVARDQNVRCRSGWFSERDACYLASGKPVVAQDTAFGTHIPTGEGLFAFSTMDEAIAAVRMINADYRRHCQAARRIAEECFEASAVARRLLTDVGLL